MLRLITVFLLFARAAGAGAPVVVTDIAPVHGLVARVMDGVGAPVLLLPPGVSPHGYALRPSQARALQRAALVVWVGPALTPWLEKPLASLAGDARTLELLDTAPDLMLSYGAQDVPDADADDEHDDHGAHDDHDHHPEGTDPHAWLDPRVAMRWTGTIAEALAAADPGNAARYRANAAEAQQELQALVVELTERLAPLQDTQFVTFHDAYRYLQRRFALTNVGTLRSGDATGPGAAKVAALRDEIARTGAVCAFAEPQFDPSLLRAAGAGGEMRLAILDPMGADLTPGPAFYPALMRSLADALAGCLGR